MRWLVASIESSCALGSWSSTWLQCTVTASPGFHIRTAEPTRSTTPAASLPTTWNGWSCRAPHTLSRPSRCRNPNVGSGSKIDVHTVLKLIDDAITATSASSGASSGSGTSSRCSDFRGSFSSDGSPANISCSSARTTAPRYEAGSGRAPSSSPGAPPTIASRIALDLGHGGRRYHPREFAQSSGVVMPGSVIVSSARTPIGKLSGALSSFAATDLGGHAIAAALARAGDHRRAGRLRAPGSGAAGRRGPDARPPGRGEGRHPDVGAVDDHQQGVPLGHQRDLPRRPDDPGGRRRDRRRRRHGVDDQGAVPPEEGARGLPHGQRRAARLDDRRRPVVRVRRRAHGRGHRALHRRARRHHARHAGRRSRPRATSAPPRR